MFVLVGAFAAVTLPACSADPDSESSDDLALKSAAKVKVTGSAQPSSVTAGQSVDIILNVSAQKAVQVDVDLSIITPSGATGCSASWTNQTLTAGVPLQLTESVETEASDAAGTYAVRVTVRRSGGDHRLVQRLQRDSVHCNVRIC